MKSIWRGLVLILTIKCEQSAQLVSESFDRELTWAERWAVRLHHRVCRSSRELAKQLRSLHAGATRLAREGLAPIEPPQPALPSTARDRIAAALERET